MKRVTFLAAVVVGSVMMGCASRPGPVAGPTAAGQEAFPVTVTAANGAVSIASRPKRILSLSATSTQMLYAIGAGPQVAAADKYSTDPPEAPRTNFSGSETSAEGYLSVHPDLVILAFDTGHNREGPAKAQGGDTGAQRLDAVTRAHYDQFRAKLQDLPGQHIQVLARGQRYDSEPPRQAGDHAETILPHRAGRTQDAESFHDRHKSLRANASQRAGAPKIRLSIRSSKPP